MFRLRTVSIVALILIVAFFVIVTRYNQNDIQNLTRKRTAPKTSGPKVPASKKGKEDAIFAGEKYEPGMELARQMMKHAWEGYRKYAWGSDILSPLSRKGQNNHPHSLLTTMIGSLDTLMMLRMDAEYLEARN
jgi:hypothetical protein